MSDEGWRAFDTAVARWRLRLALAETLPAAAVQALGAGCDAPSLGELAGMESRAFTEIAPVVEHVLRERGLPLPDDASAAACVADDLLRQMIDGALGPADGLRRLNRLWWHCDGAVEIPLADRYGDWSRTEAMAGGLDALDALGEEIRREARAILARGAVRSPGA